MDLDISTDSAPQETDPIKIFGKLTLRGRIENIWSPQEKALKEWHQSWRSEKHNVVCMNTGGGKTLVGLLMAQSLTNELRQKVVYVCANNQLVEQTIDQASECGISVASRFQGGWQKKELFDNGEAFCITNYATVFNGRSVFREDDLGAVLFDDAHVAEGVIRDQFTITIDSDTKELYSGIFKLFRPYFLKQGFNSAIEDIERGNRNQSLLVPSFQVKSYSSNIRKLISKHLSDNGNDRIQFPWQHLKNHIEKCCTIIAADRIEISPALPPMHTLDYLDGARKLYLTATIPTLSSFVRTFGISTPNVITPKGKSGEAQRLFVFSQEAAEDHRTEIKRIIEKDKCCIIVPSGHHADQWNDIGTVFSSEDGHGHKQIRDFCESEGKDKLILVARYDGIDLPGKSCRMMVIDGIPTGESLLERFWEEHLRLNMIRKNLRATRITQAIGRIFRSNTDHGVVLLAGEKLNSWLRDSGNRKLLPHLVQKQLRLGIEIGKNVAKGKWDYDDIVRQMLAGDKDWDSFYSDYIDKFEPDVAPGTDEAYVAILSEEQTAFRHMWNNQYEQAATAYGLAAEKARGLDINLTAWYLHWQGFCFQAAGNNTAACKSYVASSREKSQLGKPAWLMDTPPEGAPPSQQTKNLYDFYSKKQAKFRSQLSAIIDELKYGEEHVFPTEEHLKELGTLLGLDSTRPDKKYDTGPDVLWLLGGEAVLFEAKTGKESTSKYYKKEMGECHDHRQWVIDNHSPDKLHQYIIGRELDVDRKANPDTELQIIDLKHFVACAEKLSSVLDCLEAEHHDEDSDALRSLHGWLKREGLLFPKVVTSCPSKYAADLKEEC